MLARLCKREPGLREAIGAIRACVAMVFRLYQQQQMMFRSRERAVAELNQLCAALTPTSSAAEFDAVLRRMNKIEDDHRTVRPQYGWDHTEVADNGWLADFSPGRMRSTFSGRFRPVGHLRYEPFEPFDLHDPLTWHPLVSSKPLVFAGGRYCWLSYGCPDFTDQPEAPRRDVVRIEPPPDRYRALVRRVRLKGSGAATWPIARSLDENGRPLIYWERHDWPGTPSSDRICLTPGTRVDLVQDRYGRALTDNRPVATRWVRLCPACADDGRLRYRTDLMVPRTKHEFISERAAATIAPGYLPHERQPKRRPYTRTLEELEIINTGGGTCVPRRPLPMCNPTRWIPLPPAREPHGMLKPFTRWNLLKLEAKGTEARLVKQTPGAAPLFLVRS